MVRERKATLRNVWHGVLGNAAYQLLTGGAVLGAVTAIGAWLHRLPEAWQGAFYGGAVALVAIGIGIASKRLIRRRRIRGELSPSQAKVLSVRAYTDHLFHLYRDSQESLTAVFAKREFALLEVTNAGPRNLSQVVARCRFQQGTEDFCVWSLRTGTPPFDPGTHEADLSAGNSRLLVVARGFGDEELWARLPPEGEPFHIISRIKVVSRNWGNDEEEIMLVSNSGDVRTLPKEIPISIAVTFQASEFYQEERFSLSFNHGKPTITPATGEHDATAR